MKVLVTGGAGFIGSYVCKKLVERGDHVWVLDVQRPSNELVERGQVPVILVSVTDRRAVNDWISRLNPDWVLHLGAMANTRDCRDNPQGAWEVNVIGTENVLGACKDLHIRSLFASTTLLSSVMVFDAVHRELGAFEESLMRMSSDVYCATKQAGEAIAKRCGSVICRFGICYGPGMTPGVLFEIFIRRALNGEVLYLDGGGDVRRQYTYVEDLADGVIVAMGQGVGPYHLGASEWTRPVDVANYLKGMLPDVTVEVREGREEEIICGPLLVNTKLVWFPQVGLAEGLRRTIEWYRLTKEGQTK